MKVAFVTGANRGIGLAIIKKLANAYSPTGKWDVYLTARDVERGKNACNDLAKDGLNVKFHQLDITDVNSRKEFLRYIQSKYTNGIDIAVNNAGIMLKGDCGLSFGEQAERTVDTNFTQTVNFTHEFLPFLSKDARVVHLSTSVGLVALKKLSPALKAQFSSSINLDELRSLMDNFVKHAKAGDHEAHGWLTGGLPFPPSYGISKLGLMKASFVMGDSIKHDPRRIVMNVCCPGYVSTDMTDHKGTKTPEKGADTPFYLATLPVGITEPINQYVVDRKIKKPF